MKLITSIVLFFSVSVAAQTQNHDKIYTKNGRVLECNITKISEYEIFYNFIVKSKKYNSTIFLSQVDSVFNGQRFLSPSELQADTVDNQAQADSLPPPQYQQALLVNTPVHSLSQKQRMDLAGYYLERSANYQIGALVTVAGSAIIGAFLTNTSPEAATGIFWAGITVACVLEVSAIFQKRKAGRYLRNTY